MKYLNAKNNKILNKKKLEDNLNEYQINKIKELETHIEKIKKIIYNEQDNDLCFEEKKNINTILKPKINTNKFINKQINEHVNKEKDEENENNYKNRISINYLNWINSIKKNITDVINETELYYFFMFEPKISELTVMSDYWDVPQTNKLFSFSLFISNVENLSYLIGLVYNYAIMIKHFTEYKMRLYIDFHTVFGSPETFNLFNMFLDILEEIDPTFNTNIQMILFFLNPYHQVNNLSIYEPIIYDIDDVINYYNMIFYNTKFNNINSKLKNIILKSPLLNIKLEDININIEPNKIKKTFSDASTESKENITINIDNLEISYNNLNKPTQRSTFSMFSTHLAVNLRFLPMNENCEFHVRDLDSRLSMTDINIINKFSNPKYKYVPFYVFQFYKFYFPYLKWRIDVNPYLAGCFGGSNKKPITISAELEESENLKILKKEIFFKYILFISFNAANLQIGFLNDEFILANIFEKIKGLYSENVLFLNLGSFANKHVNEFYYGLTNSPNYPCMLKLGTPIDILRYPLNGKYITIDPITDFKIGVVSTKNHNLIKKLIIEQLNIYLKKTSKEKNILANFIRKNYKTRLDDKIDSDLEAALFFSMVPKKYNNDGLEDYDLETYTSNSFSNQIFSSIGSSLNITDNDKLIASNIMMAGYLLADVLEEIIFPLHPQYINSNYFLSSDNYDRLFNCMYWDEVGKKFVQRKINKKDISRKYIDQNIISHIPSKLIEFDDKNKVIHTLNQEFNEYLKTCSYYPSLHWYIKRLSFNSYIEIGNKKIKSGTILFVKNYTLPLENCKDENIYEINPNSVKTLKYKLAGKKDTIKGIEVAKNKLKYNVMLIDDKYINQFSYSNKYDNFNKEKIDIKMLKFSHLNNLENIIKSNKNNDYIVIGNF